MLPWHMLMGGDRWCFSLLRDLGGAQLVTEELSLSRRSPACRGGAQPYRVRWGYGDAASDDRVCLALSRLCDPDPVAPAFGSSISCLVECERATSSERKAP
ncbi:hypothetical protein Syun_001237 [Stephania yunnanensis]|uniref:Uncharacterized protein n=1 Tax=Stephania yunnanensis TaxID=152371 RepID=A0AAP0LF54_9MAGN